MNTFGERLRVTTFGESHGVGIGAVIDGLPAGVRPDMERIAVWMSRRRPGSTPAGTARNETDEIEWLSGLYEGVTTGAPLAYLIRNRDARPADYGRLDGVYRPSHADYVYEARYGLPRDARGGGRSSARWTAALIPAGEIAAELLSARGVRVCAYTCAIGGVEMSSRRDVVYDDDVIYASDVRCPDAEAAARMSAAVSAARAEGDSTGGMIACVIEGLRAGVGSPMGDKLSSRLAAAMFAVNAVKGVEFGDGFAMASMRGSEAADCWEPTGAGVAGAVPESPREIRTRTNHSGGIQGGISNGMPIVMRIAMKPTPTIAKTLDSVDRTGMAVEVCGHGRHDPCVVPRGVAVVRAMAALTVLDALL